MSEAKIINRPPTLTRKQARTELFDATLVRAAKLGSAPDAAMIDEIACREYGGDVAAFYRNMSDRSFAKFLSEVQGAYNATLPEESEAEPEMDDWIVTFDDGNQLERFAESAEAAMESARRVALQLKSEATPIKAEKGRFDLPDDFFW